MLSIYVVDVVQLVYRLKNIYQLFKLTVLTNIFAQSLIQN